jgi:hypothetical protein
MLGRAGSVAAGTSRPVSWPGSVPYAGQRVGLVACLLARVPGSGDCWAGEFAGPRMG